MTDPIRSFYDPLAEHYHLLFDDWDKAIDRQSRVLGPLLSSRSPAKALKILDCACGIGTQSFALAKLGHRVTGSDLSLRQSNAPRNEARKALLQIDFYVSDMTSLQEITDKDFDVVVALDNALPHLSLDQLASAASAMKSVLKPGGLLMASIRDYDQILRRKTNHPAARLLFKPTAADALCIRSGTGSMRPRYVRPSLHHQANRQRLGFAPFRLGVSLHSA